MTNEHLLSEGLLRHGIPFPKRFFRSSGFTRWGKNARYWARPVGDGWVFGDFVDGISETAFENQRRRYSLEERETREYEIAKARREAEELQRDQWERTAEKAKREWEDSPLIDGDDHPYLKRKRVVSYGLKHSKFNSLVVPAYDISGKLWTLQFIDINGDKKFLTGGRKKGRFFTIGHTSVGEFKKRILLCEGYATGASIYQATGEQTIVCFDAGNLLPVAWEIRAKYPEAEIIICADNDDFKEVNTGIEKAIKAGNAIGAYVVFPVFQDVSTQPTDFNDLQNLEGLDRVYEQVSGAFRSKKNG